MTMKTKNVASLEVEGSLDTAINMALDNENRLYVINPRMLGMANLKAEKYMEVYIYRPEKGKIKFERSYEVV